uniref:myosin heavy chain, non-muscle-like n=1 Tax=Erigeron canadensis TaxID=72917 RepID=UPI001CB9D253|nr:myosin heavy chain, non-muscle-like [Erigeron canadensis]
MKKLFFFKSSTTSSNGTSNLSPKDKQSHSENSSGDGPQGSRKHRSRKAAYEDQIQNQNGPFLRKSRSYSSGTVHDSGLLRTQSDSPCSSSSNVSQKHCASRSSRRALTPERPSRAKWFENSAVDAAERIEKLNFAGLDNNSSESISNSSTNTSNKVVDRYIDGEQHQERSSIQINSNTRNHVCQANGGGKRPPRFQYAAPESPTDGGYNQKPRSHSFRDPKRESKLYMSTRDWVENGIAHGSPRKLAKQVIERLSQARVMPRVDSNEFEHDIPITLEDIYGQSQNILPRDGPVKEAASFEERNYGHDDTCTRVLEYEESDETDEITLLKAELECRTRKLEKEKIEMQVALEKELDRRSTEWSLKLEKYQMEEHRLRERVRELAEQNVSLQREVSMFGERELDSQSRVVHAGKQVKDLTVKMEEVVKENQNLHQSLSSLQDKYSAAEGERDLLKRNYSDKDKECKELHRAVTKFLRTCNEQGKTIEGLQEGFSKDLRKFDHNQQSKLQTELLRLTGVEQSLRKELESYRLEVDSLRHENINLLHRLKGSAKDDGFSTFKLDQELWSRIHCLQNQGMCLINDSVQLCSKLFENVKERACYSSLETKQGNERLHDGLNSQFIVDSDMKLQGFKTGAESLTRSLQTVSDVLHEKSCAGAPDKECFEDVAKSDLKAEALMTRVLREKLYSKEVDVERLEAEVAAAVRGNDILRCEVQNAMDNLSCITHKMKDLEIQQIKKDESIYRLQNELQDCKKELAIVNGILPKVSEERDMMWEEVKKYSENNMLLSSEVGMLKKKVEDLDEAVLTRDGQITILKDAIGKPFDLFSSPVTNEGFLLR